MAVFDALGSIQELSLPHGARELANAGVPVFPCVPGEKRPLTRHGFHDATTNLEQVTAWWRRWPTANVAIPTGSASGVEVVDIDTHSDGSGFPALQRARSEGLIKEWCALVRTPSGGLHLYFTSDALREQNSWQAPKAHVDFRGTGGYVLVPPSRVTQPDGETRPYQLRSNIAVGVVPVDADRLRNFLDPRPMRPSRDGASTTRESDVQRLSRWVSALGEGERNRGLFWAACRLAENRTSAADAFAELGPAAEHTGLGTREITTTIRSAYRAVHPAPASLPRDDTSPARPQHASGRVIA